MNRRTFMALAAAAPLATTTRVRAEDRIYRACVIGDAEHGGYGHNLHRLWNLREDIEVVGLAEPHPRARRHYAAEANAANSYADYREMLETEQPDLVVVAPRWTIHHKEHLLACAEFGAHGIVEKPLAVDLAEIDTIIAAMDEKNLRWNVAHNFRASPIVHHARKAIFEDGIIGEVVEMRARGKEDHRAGGEDLIVLGVHLFDMMVSFAGQPEWCWADVQHEGRRATRDDIREATEPLGPILGETIHAMYGFPNGIVGHFASSKTEDGDGGRWGLDIYGTKGIVTIRMFPAPAVYMLPDSTWAPGGRDTAWQPIPGTPEVTLEGPDDHYKPIVDDLIAAIEEDRPATYNLEDARWAHEMIQGVFESALSGERVSLPLERREHPLNAE